MQPSVRAFGSLVVVAAVLAGCGGPYKGLSKAEFVEQANAICTKARKDSDALAKKLPPKMTRADTAKFLTAKALPLLNQELDQLAKLKPPKADRARVKAIISEARGEVSSFAAELTANPNTTLIGSIDPLAKSNRDEKVYGMTACGSGS